MNSLKTDEDVSLHLNTPRSTFVSLNNEKDFENEFLKQQRLEAYIRGDHMPQHEEKLALQTLKSISAIELYKTVEDSLKTICNLPCNCKCQTCHNYNSAYLNCDLRRNKFHITKMSANNQITEIKQSYLNENIKYLKYIDSLKVAIGSLNINDIGWQTISASLSDSTPANLINYFLEYSISDCLIAPSKIGTGIKHNTVKLCAKKLNSEIFFKHIELHNLKKLTEISINSSQIQFKIRYRGYKQKKFILLGVSTFNFQELLLQKKLTCAKGLILQQNTNLPIAVGTLKILIQLGGGELYFGQEFIGMLYILKYFH